MLSLKMSGVELANTNMQAENVNKGLGVKASKKSAGEMGKESFLKLLVTQLQHQDPTKPMEDKQFIAQMAQFSSLEQMTNMNKEMGKLLSSFKSNEAYSILGKRVDAFDPVKKLAVTGIASSIKFVDNQPKILVGNTLINPADISSVYTREKDK
jgi:flagellar basal-body rod modification protein FlgD